MLRILFLLQFSMFFLSSLDYELPEKYFINCGSDSDAPVGERIFVGDKESRSSGFSPGRSTVVEAANSSDVLHRTARVYKQTSAYGFDLTKTGTYLLRLHFFAFSNSKYNLADAIFNVSASGISLLSNFRVNNSGSNSVVIKEYLLKIDVGKFSVYFVPSEKTSFAFVNAMEVFIAPENFIPNGAPGIPPVGSNGNYEGLQSKVLHTIHKINVGGSNIIPEQDTLLRNWIPDDDYLSFGDFAENYMRDVSIYRAGSATKYDAPLGVYNSAKKLNATYNISDLNSSIIQWRFPVKSNSRHLVRVHFSEIMSDSTSVGLTEFNLFIYSSRKVINTFEMVNILATPFYLDFVVESDNSRYMNVSIGYGSDPSASIKTAFLNGLEILEFMELGYDPKSDPKKKSSFLITGSVGGAAVVLVLIGVLLLVLKYRKRNPVKTSIYGNGSSYDRTISSATPLAHLNFKLKMQLNEILEATNNFDPLLVIGEGGFGKVYKGILRSGKEVAVKRSDSKHNQGLPEFQTEIMVLSRIRHRHLVSLIGYCEERSEMILVYEFMKNGTLREHLYDSKNLFENSSTLVRLPWKQRIQICIGSAKGLQYLHNGLDWGVIHRDVKSTNILLDEEFVAKVADFGIARSGSADSEDVSMGVKGTFGYLDPEYFKCFQLTDKSDVYSFGVLLLEVLCARPAIMNSTTREEVNLAEWGMLWKKKGQLEKIIDPFLVGKINPNSLRKFAELAERCLSDNGVDRPTMGDVLWDLEYTLKLQETAIRKEAYEDSTSDVSQLRLPALGRFPSNSFLYEEDEAPKSGHDICSDVTASDVFSQLKMDAAR